MNKLRNLSVFLSVIMAVSLLTAVIPIMTPNNSLVTAQHSSDWTTPENITLLDTDAFLGALGPSSQSALAIDSNGYVHAVYVQQSDTAEASAEVYYVTNIGGNWSWTNISKVNDSDFAGLWPVIAVDSNGVVHIVFMVNVVPASFIFDIMYANNSGGSWHSWENVSRTNTTATDAFPTLCIDKTNKLHLAYYSEWSGGAGIMYTSYTASSGWTTPVNITTGIWSFDNIIGNLAIDTDSFNNVYVAFSGYNGTSINSEVYIMNNTGGTWSAPVNVSQNLATTPYKDLSPSIDIDIYNTLHVSWLSTNNTIYGVYYRSYSIPSNTWSSSTLVNATAGKTEHCSIKADLGGRVHLVFDQKNTTVSAPSNYEIYYTSNLNGSFNAPTNITGTDGYDEVWPYLGLDTTGYVHIIYVNETSPSQILYTRSVTAIAAFADYTIILIVGVTVGVVVAITAVWFFFRVRKPQP